MASTSIGPAVSQTPITARAGERTAAADRIISATSPCLRRFRCAKGYPLFADDLLPGVGDEVSLGEALRVGGVATFVVLMLLNSLDELEAATLSVLAPDIRNSFGVSNGVIVFLASASGAFLVLGALPMGWLADRFRRGSVIGWASLFFAGFLALCGLVVNAFQLFWTRLGVGIAKSNTLPVHGSMLADTYPIGARGRVAASMAMGAS